MNRRVFNWRCIFLCMDAVLTGRELQLFLSLVETEYESQNHPSYCATIAALTEQTERRNLQTMWDVFRYLKNKHGQPSGMLSLVCSKRVYDVLQRTEMNLFELFDVVSDETNFQLQEIRDDLLCRTLSHI